MRNDARRQSLHFIGQVFQPDWPMYCVLLFVLRVSPTHGIRVPIGPQQAGVGGPVFGA